MKPTSRDKLLLAILPAILIIAVYGWILSSNPRDALKTAKKEYETAMKNQPSLGSLTEQEVKLDSLRKKKQVITSETKQLRDTVEGMKDRWLQSHNSTETIAQLTDLLNRNGLVLIDEGPEEGGAKLTGRLSTMMNQVANSVSNKSQQSPMIIPMQSQTNRGATLWKVRFIGRYIDVIAALHEISESDTLIIPVSISMEEVSGEGTVRSWTLYVWV